MNLFCLLFRCRYTFDNTSSYADSSFSRVAYHLQLDDEWVFTSMNAFVKNSANLGLPVDAVKDYDDIGRLNVISNAPSLQNISGTTHMQGMIEFWSNCYGTGGGSGYDANDDISATTDCYGSFQVTHHSLSTCNVPVVMCVRCLPSGRVV